MFEVEVYIFHPTKPTEKKIMLYNEFLTKKNENGYIYRAYQIGFNQTII